MNADSFAAIVRTCEPGSGNRLRQTLVGYRSLRLSLAEYCKQWLIQMKLGEPLIRSIAPLMLDAT